MLFQVKITDKAGVSVPAEPVEAADGHAAVDAARAAHIPPEEGGEFNIVVSCSTQWQGAPYTEHGVLQPGKLHAPGIVSGFSVKHEPAPHLREAIEAAAREDVARAEAAALKAAHFEEFAKAVNLTPEQVSAFKGQVSK